MESETSFLLSSDFGILVKAGSIFRICGGPLAQEAFTGTLTHGEDTPLFLRRPKLHSRSIYVLRECSFV